MESPLIIEASENATHSMIILHGLGASKYDFQPIASYLTTKLPSVRFILPQASNLAVTLNAGYVMPAWYDIMSLTDEKAINADDLTKASKIVIDLISQEIIKGIKPENIIIAGFSQGGAVILDTAFNHYHEPLAGIIALSSYGPSIDDNVKINDTRKKTPTLIIHGKHDPVLSIELAQKAFQRLTKAGANIKFIDYPMEHQVIEEEIFYLEEWLKRIITS